MNELGLGLVHPTEIIFVNTLSYLSFMFDTLWIFLLFSSSSTAGIDELFTVMGMRAKLNRKGG